MRLMKASPTTCKQKRNRTQPLIVILFIGHTSNGQQSKAREWRVNIIVKAVRTCEVRNRAASYKSNYRWCQS